ncbi:hypothetical protein [Halorubrum sp. 2020YC2]|uniref:hypothetical protein n=1 Tax=Halorubrum sp. 2020YC2 TaxID=2836432 RepID=UPI001BE602BD|nr:hypothetical protein [Halorubrum sp. 2020YC2]QWC19500.1 hypothetical protein KI388_00495 [Halorubrum sp. 2020YC2]
MTASNPVPLDAFATELRSLDSDGFATLVGETYAATADGVEVDPPRVTVSEGDRRTELLVVAAADERVSDDAVDTVDAVAVASDSVDDLGAELDADVVTPADLRERLLYAVPPAEANATADRLLGVPVRSDAYDAADSDAGTADGDGNGVTDVDGDESDDDRATVDDGAAIDDGAATGAVASGATGSGVAPSPPSADRGAAGSTDDSRTRDRPTESAADAPGDLRSPRTVLAAVAVAALLVAAAGGGFAAGTAGLGGLAGIAGVGDGGATDPSATDADATGATNESDDGSGGSVADGDDGSGESVADGDGGDTASVADGDSTGEAARNTAPSPTCDRSALQVVQVQMNALRYNDDATNDGIRTLRAFASPENRDVVGSVGQYAELFETERYAPMLAYDTAEYSVPEVTDDTAAVEVVTRENGSVTGRYEFRLVRVAGGSGDADGSLGDADDCWMTDAVAASVE